MTQTKCKECKGKKHGPVKRIFEKLTKRSYEPLQCPRCNGSGYEP